MKLDRRVGPWVVVRGCHEHRASGRGRTSRLAPRILAAGDGYADAGRHTNRRRTGLPEPAPCRRCRRRPGGPWSSGAFVKEGRQELQRRTRRSSQLVLGSGSGGFPARRLPVRDVVDHEGQPGAVRRVVCERESADVSLQHPDVRAAFLLSSRRCPPTEKDGLHRVSTGRSGAEERPWSVVDERRGGRPALVGDVVVELVVDGAEGAGVGVQRGDRCGASVRFRSG